MDLCIWEVENWESEIERLKENQTFVSFKNPDSGRIQTFNSLFLSKNNTRFTELMY